MPEASVNFGSGVTSAWSNVATFVPKFVVFLIILIVGYFVAKAIAKILSRILTRVGFDKLIERGGVKTALDRSKYDASDILAKIVYYAIMLFVLSTAFGVFGSNPISAYLHAVIAYLPLLFVALVIVIIAAAIAAGAKSLIENSLGGLSYARVLGNLASGFILAIGIIAALDQLHIAQNVVNAVLYAVLAALVGIAIVAIGGGGIRTMSGRWEAVAARYDEEKPRIAAATRNAPSVTDQARQAMPDGTSDGSSSYGATATATRPQSTDPYRPGEPGEYPSGTGL
jgi:Flp pilus assembly pilin Flp